MVTLLLIVTSIICYHGANDTILIGQFLFYMDGTTKLKWYYYLYEIMYTLKFSFLIILLIYARSNLKPYVLTIIVVILLNTYMISRDNIYINNFTLEPLV
jgi:hypothetical protein